MLVSTRSMKFAGALMIASISATSLVAPRPAHAIIAAATGGTAIPALIVLSAGILTEGAGMVITIDSHLCNAPGRCTSGPAPVGQVIAVVGMLGILAGIVMLDDSGAPTTQFKKISPAYAAQHGIDARQLASFNRQLPRVNAVSQSIAREIAKQKPETTEAALRIGQDRWRDAVRRGVISDASYEALGIVSKATAQQLKQQAAR